MKIEFESGDPTQVLFKEKHLITVTENISVSTLIDVANKNTSLRTFVGKQVSGNSIMAMTLAHQQMLFQWLIKNKASTINKIKKGDSPYDISGIPCFGCVIFKDVARAKGALTLGLQRKTGTVWVISHFSRHDWTGSVKLTQNLLLKV